MTTVIVDPPRAHFNLFASSSRGVVNFIVMIASSMRHEEYKYNLKRESDWRANFDSKYQMLALLWRRRKCDIASWCPSGLKKSDVKHNQNGWIPRGLNHCLQFLKRIFSPSSGTFWCFQAKPTSFYLKASIQYPFPFVHLPSHSFLGLES